MYRTQEKNKREKKHSKQNIEEQGQVEKRNRIQEKKILKYIWKPILIGASVLF